jgi:hypothetical protein
MVLVLMLGFSLPFSVLAGQDSRDQNRKKNEK